MLILIGNALNIAALALALSFILPLLSLLTGAVLPVANRLATLFEIITTRIARTVMWAVILMACVQVSVVILRYVFGINFIWLQESMIYMHGALFLLSAGFVLLTDTHVRVDVFYREASPRRKALVDFLGTYIFLLPICLLIIWASGPYVARSWAIFEHSTEATGIHGVFVLKSMIPAFAGLLLMAGFVIATRAAETLRPKKRPA